MTDFDCNQAFLHARRALFDAYYSQLNPAQRRAVFCVEGPLLVLAGAGSGKTTVLANRIAHIIRFGNAYADSRVPHGMTEADVAALQNALSDDRDTQARVLQSYTQPGCPPWAVLSITFTNKAANEMKERLMRTVGTLPDGSTAKEICAGTFHSVCLRILRRYTAEVGYAPGFTVYDTDDCKRLILSIIKDLKMNEKTLPPKTVMGIISQAKDQLMTPDTLASRSAFDARARDIVRIWREYQTRMKAANVMDFDDIIVNTVTLLQTCEDARTYVQHRFRYVCVDEYQDTNHAQFELVKLLSGHYRNLMVVGDDDQSIYKFRGACIENILNFERDMGDACVVKLEQNYRSTSYILEAANSVISHNKGRKDKTLFTDNGNGEKVVVHCCDNQTDEARYIAQSILALSQKEARPFSDFAVLYRTNAMSNFLEQTFARLGIPYRIVGGLRFYERKEIKDILSYLCLISNAADDLRLKRIINEPKRKIGDTTVNAVEALAHVEGVSMTRILENADRYTALRNASQRLESFARMMEELRRFAQDASLSALIEQVIDRTGYRAMLEAQGEEGRDRLENCEELISNAVAYEEANEGATLQSFLEEVALVSDIDNYDAESQAVVMMTIHSAKGLEFPVVYLPGWEQGLFPDARSLTDPEQLEEERRLAYVAITRARERLFCTHARERLLFGKTQYNPPSCFLSEISDSCAFKDGIPKQRSSLTNGYAIPERRVSFGEMARPTAVGANTGRNSFSRFEVGDTVHHAKFGRGEVLSVTDLVGDCLYEIAFDTVGTKKLMATYARLTKD